MSLFYPRIRPCSEQTWTGARKRQRKFRRLAFRREDGEGWLQEEIRFLFGVSREDNCYLNSERMAADLVLASVG